MRLGIRELIFFAVLLAVPVASFVYVFKPRNEEIREAETEIEVKQARLDRLAELVAQIDDIGLAIEEGREAIELIEAKLPDEQDVAGLLERVTQLAKDNNLRVRKVQSEKSVPAAGYMELPLRMQMEGEFDQFYQFMLDLENLPRITRIHQMNVKRLQDVTSNGEVVTRPGSMETEFVLSIYFQPQQRDN